MRDETDRFFFFLFPLLIFLDALTSGKTCSNFKKWKTKRPGAFPTPSDRFRPDSAHGKRTSIVLRATMSESRSQSSGPRRGKTDGKKAVDEKKKPQCRALFFFSSRVGKKRRAPVLLSSARARVEHARACARLRSEEDNAARVQERRERKKENKKTERRR